MPSSLPRVDVITPTGGRPEALANLRDYLDRQTYEGFIRWIVVNDVDPVLQIPASDRVCIIERYPRWNGLPTLGLNLAHALHASRGDFCVVMEDDEWYAPGYIERMVEGLLTCDLFGLAPSIYYHVGRRLWRPCQNKLHASLATTGWRKHMNNVVAKVALNNDRFLDIKLWSIQAARRTIVPMDGLSVGIKGMPGRVGLGAGHRLKTGRKDPTLDNLRKWIGDDVANYERYGEAKP